MKAGNQSSLKKNNQRAIIEYIIENGAISRADLSKRLKISKPTVSANMVDLLSSKILMEIGYSSTDIGKKPMLVDFNRSIKYVLAMDFISYYARNEVSVAVCNLYSEPIFIDIISLPKNFNANTMKFDMPQKLLDLLKKYDINLDKIGCVVLTAATVWYDDKHVTYECSSGERVNLAEILRPYFKNKISVKNDINLAALGEKYFGVGKTYDDLLYIWVGRAIGGGIIINGKLHEGKNLSGGEFAYALIYNPLFDRVEFFRDIVDRGGINRYIDKFRDAAKDSVIDTKLLNDSFTLLDIIDAAKNGDAFCIEFGRYISKISARVILNFAHSMNIEMVVLGGEYTGLDEIFMSELDTASKNIPLAKIKFSKPKHKNSAMYGAFKFGCDQIIKKLL